MKEIHLGGHDEQTDDTGAPLADRCAWLAPSPDDVWSLYADVIGETGPLPTLIEWDNDVPDWPVLADEARAAARILQRNAAQGGLTCSPRSNPNLRRRCSIRTSRSRTMSRLIPRAGPPNVLPSIATMSWPASSMHLQAKFPATERIVGEDFFAAMARVFVTAHPPRSKILHTYGDDFGDFIAAFEPAAELPYLADVARLEAARTRAYHAADADPLTAAAFRTSRSGPAIGSMRLTLHPSLQIVCSRHPVVTIWSMNAGELPLRPHR